MCCPGGPNAARRGGKGNEWNGGLEAKRAPTGAGSQACSGKHGGLLVLVPVSLMLPLADAAGAVSGL